jgi:hypothetical protein
MIRTPLPSIAALAICASSLFAAVASAEPPLPADMAREQHWAADQAAMLDAGLAGLKAGLKLTPEQEKLWPPFDAAVRDATKLRMDQMTAMIDRARKIHDMAPHMTDMDRPDHAMDMGQAAPAVSPVDRLEAIAQRMSERGAALKKVADAAKPIYASLDESQKRLFRLLGGDMFLMPHGHHGMGMMGHGSDMMGEGGMGMMRHGPDDEDGPDEE